jgi:hypothetical protein
LNIPNHPSPQGVHFRNFLEAAIEEYMTKYKFISTTKLLIKVSPEFHNTLCSVGIERWGGHGYKVDKSLHGIYGVKFEAVLLPQEVVQGFKDNLLDVVDAGFKNNVPVLIWLTDSTYNNRDVRGTGRTTALLYSYIYHALCNPGQKIYLQDHHVRDETRREDKRWLLQQASRLLEGLVYHEKGDRFVAHHYFAFGEKSYCSVNHAWIRFDGDVNMQCGLKPYPIANEQIDYSLSA